MSMTRRRKHDRKYYRKHREEILEKQRQWARDNPEKKAASQKRWRESNKDKIREYHRCWRDANPEKLEEYRVRAKKCREAGVRTINPTEMEVAESLIDDGWEVMKKGWPDFLAVRGDEIRFIEVKQKGQRLKPQQKRMAKILMEFLNIEVEVMTD